MDKLTKLSKGDVVMVKCAGGKVATNMVWQDLGAVVMVCSERQFNALNGDFDAPMPIGFRRSDVLAQ